MKDSRMMIYWVVDADSSPGIKECDGKEGILPGCETVSSTVNKASVTFVHQEQTATTSKIEFIRRTDVSNYMQIPNDATTTAIWAHSPDNSDVVGTTHGPAGRGVIADISFLKGVYGNTATAIETTVSKKCEAVFVVNKYAIWPVSSWANNKAAGGFSGGVLFSEHFVNFDKSQIQVEIIRPGSMPKKLLKPELII